MRIRYEKERNRKKEKEENEWWTVNQIGDEGAKAISEAMKINTTLTELNLTGDDKRGKRKKSEKWKQKMNDEQTTE